MRASGTSRVRVEPLTIEISGRRVSVLDAWGHEIARGSTDRLPALLHAAYSAGHRVGMRDQLDSLRYRLGGKP